jgi:hypothetical protein
MFLLWPVLLACLMVSQYWTNLHCVAGYLSIVLLTCLTTGTVALFCSVLFQKTSTSLMCSYLVIIVLYCVPLAVDFFATEFFASHPATEYVEWVGVASPFAAAFAIPLDMELVTVAEEVAVTGNWSLYGAYVAFTIALNALLLLLMVWLFSARWRVAT